MFLKAFRCYVDSLLTLGDSSFSWDSFYQWCLGFWVFLCSLVLFVWKISYLKHPVGPTEIPFLISDMETRGIRLWNARNPYKTGMDMFQDGIIHFNTIVMCFVLILISLSKIVIRISRRGAHFRQILILKMD